MAKSKQMLYLERQVTKLKRELAAAKRAQRVSEHAVQQYKGRAELAQAQTSDYAQRLEEQYDEVTIARLQHYEYVTSWQQVGYTLLQILRTPLSQRWYNLKQPVLNWYAVKRLSDDRIQAMTEAGYNADPVKRAKVARRYWEYDKEARRNPRHDWKTVVVYKQSLRQEIVNGITQRFVRIQEGLAGAIDSCKRRAAAIFRGFEASECPGYGEDPGECEAQDSSDRAGGPSTGSVDARDYGPRSFTGESQGVCGDEGRVPEGVRPGDEAAG